ncbi:MAG: EF-hand domain-containing protein [Gammaproteobacteria bacterium]|nr:EF-hand domain-containing protein [Gammaproteobacteria bacterium]MCW8841490.1 EF-hand domain-containing protein [Gammaproteobacteria bacterium]MCW8928023.1 EF-hand domain-containing protein [Gammaproteobacteria bacterium]MCW8959459.1 EF-hand domain-containing protein [Gammaproteobacteria bacterium]MCW8972488.1 EF-hand domain-containing protein [Gammaproteobacteria bacterium]
MKHKSVAIMLLSGFFAAGAVFAQSMLFEDLDSDHNGAISMKEAKAHAGLGSNFHEADSDGNGSLSVDEYTAHMNRGKLAPEDMEIPEPGAAPVPSN